MGIVLHVLQGLCEGAGGWMVNVCGKEQYGGSGVGGRFLFCTGYGLVLALPIGQSVRSVALQVLQSDPVTLYIVYHGCRVTEAV